MESKNNPIERFQNHLLLIRRTVGWTAEEFGDKVGLSRQSINNLESHKVPLNKTVYIAMRSVLDYEIQTNREDTKMLANILEIFVDNPDKYTEQDKKDLLEKANLLSPAILAKAAPRAVVSKEWMASAAVIMGTAVAIGAVGLYAWLSKSIPGKK
jgi:DNA-binding XRE family transcriptional regulator